jgi:hypothetical protein
MPAKQFTAHIKHRSLLFVVRVVASLVEHNSTRTRQRKIDNQGNDAQNAIAIGAVDSIGHPLPQKILPQKAVTPLIVSRTFICLET